MTDTTPGHVAGPYEDRCGGCRLYQCDCPVGFLDPLGRLFCHDCYTGGGEPITRHALTGDERCDGCAGTSPFT